MPWNQNHVDWVAARLLPAIYDINQQIRYDRNTKRLSLLLEELEDHEMSVQHVKGLADIVRQTKAALAEATGAAGEMQTAAASVASKVSMVRDMTNELKAADAELGAAIGTLTNGDPNPGPLPDTVPSAPTIQASSSAPAPQQMQGAMPDFDIHTRRDRPRV